MFFRQMVVLLHFLEVAGHQQWSGYNSGITANYLPYCIWLRAVVDVSRPLSSIWVQATLASTIIMMHDFVQVELV